MERDQKPRQEILRLLDGEGAHVTTNDALKGLQLEICGKLISEFPHTIWDLVEHIRIAQWDMLEFSRKPKHASPAWPEGYWPKAHAPADQAALDSSVQQILSDLKAFQKLVSNPEQELYTPFPHGEGQTLFREALQIADHNAYHLGQVLVLRKALGDWE